MLGRQRANGTLAPSPIGTNTDATNSNAVSSTSAATSPSSSAAAATTTAKSPTTAGATATGPTRRQQQQQQQLQQHPQQQQRRGAQQRRQQRRNSTAQNAGKAFNPQMIFSQIVAMQCFHYFFLGVMIQINSLLYGTSITLDRMFTDKYLKIWSWKEVPDQLAIFMCSIIGAVFLAIIVEKSKKCLDFSVTLFMIHFFICIGYNGLPRTWDWYIVHVTATIVMILLGEYICSRRELDDIPLLQL